MLPPAMLSVPVEMHCKTWAIQAAAVQSLCTAVLSDRSLTCAAKLVALLGILCQKGTALQCLKRPQHSQHMVQSQSISQVGICSHISLPMPGTAAVLSCCGCETNPGTALSVFTSAFCTDSFVKLWAEELRSQWCMRKHLLSYSPPGATTVVELDLLVVLMDFFVSFLSINLILKSRSLQQVWHDFWYVPLGRNWAG